MLKPSEVEAQPESQEYKNGHAAALRNRDRPMVGEGWEFNPDGNVQWGLGHAAAMEGFPLEIPYDQFSVFVSKGEDSDLVEVELDQGKIKEGILALLENGSQKGL